MSVVYGVRNSSLWVLISRGNSSDLKPTLNTNTPTAARSNPAHLAWLCRLIVVWGMIDRRRHGGRKPFVEKELLDTLDTQLIAGDQRCLLLSEIRDDSLGLLIWLSRRVFYTRVGRVVGVGVLETLIGRGVVGWGAGLLFPGLPVREMAIVGKNTKLGGAGEKGMGRDWRRQEGTEL